MLISNIKSPGVVIDEQSAFPAGVTPVASPLPPFLDSTENAPAENAPGAVQDSAAEVDESQGK